LTDRQSFPNAKTPYEKALVSADFIEPLSTMVKFLTISKDPSGTSAICLFVCDGISGVGTSAALFAAYKLNDEDEEERARAARLQSTRIGEVEQKGRLSWGEGEMLCQ
jgi:hypothetical protein